MVRRLVVQPPSDLDIQSVAVWCEDQRPGLSLRFLDELDLVFQRIGGNLRQFPHVEGAVHRALLQYFPYGVYFLAELDDIKILAALHLRREPDMWKRRIRRLEARLRLQRLQEPMIARSSVKLFAGRGCRCPIDR